MGEELVYTVFVLTLVFLRRQREVPRSLRGRIIVLSSTWMEFSTSYREHLREADYTTECTRAITHSGGEEMANVVTMLGYLCWNVPDAKHAAVSAGAIESLLHILRNGQV